MFSLKMFTDFYVIIKPQSFWSYSKVILNLSALKNEVRSVYKAGTKDEKKSKGVIPDATQKYAGEKL